MAPCKFPETNSQNRTDRDKHMWEEEEENGLSKKKIVDGVSIIEEKSSLLNFFSILYSESLQLL